MVHILLCPHRLDYGGSQLSLLHWARHLDKSRFRVSVLAMAKGGLSEKFEANFPVYYDDPDYSGISEHIKRLKPDLVHAGPPGGRDFAYITEAARLAPVTQTVMCPRPVGNYNDVAGSVVISKFVLSLQPKKENVFQIDLPFDAADYDLKYDKRYFGLPEGKLIIGSIGNHRKENAHFFDITRHFKNPGVHFVIKTDLRYRYLLGRNRVTRINRHLSEDEKMSLMNCLDIFLYPTSNEAYGLVFVEAMSREVPVITYDDSANREVVDGGGLLAPLNDIKAMTGLLDELVRDGRKRKALGEKGRELVLGRNTPERIASEYEMFFETAIDMKRAASHIPNET
ncbi:MAG: glycosyltransferase family 4 protein [Deltaproteobacteria bacterium]|nr:glycosyltransferase family 4 protein [Deltaproteobacteria bacterium]